MPDDDLVPSVESETQTDDTKQNFRQRVELNLNKFFELTADDVNVPRSKVVGIPENMDPKRSLKIVNKHLYSNYPVHKEDNIDEIVGIVSIKDMLLGLGDKKNQKIGDLMGPVHFVSFSEPLWQVLQKFQDRKIKTAVVVNEYGEADGLICAEDILEELVGDIADIHDQPEPHLIEQGENKLTISGQFKMDEFIERFGLNIDVDITETLSGYISHMLGKIPEAGEICEIGDLKIEILESDTRKISLVSIEIIEQKEGQ